MTENSQGKIFVISGPSGVGKSTIVKAIVERTHIQRSVSATTRPQGKDEKDGRDYWFLTEQEFQEKIDNNQLLEYANVFGNMYGTPKDKVDELLNQGKSVILEIDTQGGKLVKELYPDAVMIFLLPPTASHLEKRMEGRGRETDVDEKVKRKRLESAGLEIADAWRCYDHMVINDDLNTAINEVEKIINGER